MYMAELGFHIRRARKARGLTQFALAAKVGIARETLSQLEGGIAKDLGFAKVARLLGALDLELRLLEATSTKPNDPVALAATAGSTGFRDALGGEELVHALLSGRPPARKSPHFRRLLEDAPPRVVAKLVSQVSHWTNREKVVRNLLALARELDVTPQPEWTQSD